MHPHLNGELGGCISTVGGSSLDTLGPIDGKYMNTYGFNKLILVGTGSKWKIRVGFYTLIFLEELLSKQGSTCTYMYINVNVKD